MSIINIELIQTTNELQYNPDVFLPFSLLLHRRSNNFIIRCHVGGQNRLFQNFTVEISINFLQRGTIKIVISKSSL
jgi:hypothetical protein